MITIVQAYQAQIWAGQWWSLRTWTLWTSLNRLKAKMFNNYSPLSAFSPLYYLKHCGYFVRLCRTLPSLNMEILSPATRNWPKTNNDILFDTYFKFALWYNIITFQQIYSSHLNTWQVWYSNGPNMSGCQIMFLTGGAKLDKMSVLWSKMPSIQIVCLVTYLSPKMYFTQSASKIIVPPKEL